MDIFKRLLRFVFRRKAIRLEFPRYYVVSTDKLYYSYFKKSLPASKRIIDMHVTPSIAKAAVFYEEKAAEQVRNLCNAVTKSDKYQVVPAPSKVYTIQLRFLDVDNNIKVKL